MSLYKIQNEFSRKFSSGGLNPHFSNNGKLWKSEKDLKAHIRLLKDRFDPYENCEIIEYEMVEKAVLEIKDFR